MSDRFVVLAGGGDAAALVEALGLAGVGVSASLLAARDPRCSAVCLVPPVPAVAAAAARAAAARGLAVFCFADAAPRPLAPGGAWFAVAGAGVWSAAWRWFAVAPAPAQLALL